MSRGADTLGGTGDRHQPFVITALGDELQADRHAEAIEADRQGRGAQCQVIHRRQVVHDLAIARPELLGAGFFGENMRREHDGRRRDDVDIVKMRSSALRRRLQPQPPAQIVAPKEFRHS